jgi:hypothetical protein
LSGLVEASTAAAFNGIGTVVIGMTSHLIHSAARTPKGAATIVTSSAGGGWDIVLLANPPPRLAHGNQDVHPEGKVQDVYES